MAADTNVVVLIGRLTKDPEMKYNPEGIAVTKFTMAVNGYKEGDTSFLRIVAFRKTAEIAGEFLKKGSRASIAGSIKAGSYEKDGVTVYTTDIIANSLQLLTPKDKSEGVS